MNSNKKLDRTIRARRRGDQTNSPIAGVLAER